ncbi:hypothetical protein F4810DRAFT_712453 [Camillea tinctor]|nr:hypothetical protein F4810DRAFT_712453 [Camillea tinctor]
MRPSPLPLLASLITATAATTGHWSLWLNGQDDCDGSSYEVHGDGPSACTALDRTHFPFGTLASVLVDTDVHEAGGYCKVELYAGDGCTGDVIDYTAYSTDTSRGGPGLGEYCWNGRDLARTHSWKVYCTP